MSEAHRVLGPDVADAFRESEEIERAPDRVVRTDVKVTRGHRRSRVLQVRLNDDEYAALERLASAAADGGLPVSTLARALLLEAMAGRPDDNAGTAPALGAVQAHLLRLSAMLAETAEHLGPAEGGESG